MSTRFGELLDLIAIEQIKREGFERKRTEDEEVDDFFRMLSRR